MRRQLLAAGLLWLGACAGSSAATGPLSAEARRPNPGAGQPTAHHVLDPARLARVEVGETTREDLLRLFGYPTRRRTMDDGGEIWVYASALAPAGGSGSITTRTQRVPAQVMLEVTFAPDSPAVTGARSFTTGEREADPLRDAGPPFPDLPPESVAADAPSASPGG